MPLIKKEVIKMQNTIKKLNNQKAAYMPRAYEAAIKRLTEQNGNLKKIIICLVALCALFFVNAQSSQKKFENLQNKVIEHNMRVSEGLQTAPLEILTDEQAREMLK